MEKVNVQEVEILSEAEVVEVTGGGPEDYNAGYRLGTAVREAVTDAWDYVKGVATGLFS